MMKKYTPILFWVSLTLSAFSYVLASNGGSEIYPFYFWKLFTKPSGAAMEERFYKIYGIRGTDTLRLQYQDTPLYDGNDQFSFINRWGSQIDASINPTANEEKLKKLLKATAPQYERYLLVEETFNPHHLKADQTPTEIKKRIVITLKNERL